MHTTIIISLGLVLLTLMLFIGEKIGFSRQMLDLQLHRALAGADADQWRGRRGLPASPSRQKWWWAATCSVSPWRRWCCSWC